MSSLARFLRKNKAVKENTTFAATKSLCDENGKPLLWEIQAISTRQDEQIRDACTSEIPIPGKPNMYRNRVNANKYIAAMLTASVVYPDLMDAELQDSYGVKTPEDLLKEMINNPGEYADFAAFVQSFNGFNTALEEQADEVKNA